MPVRERNSFNPPLTSNPRATSPFSCAPKLTLSQDSHGEEEIHELVVDLENDRDGEGVSRWAAMTEFLSLISYQVRSEAPLKCRCCLMEPGGITGTRYWRLEAKFAYSTGIDLESLGAVLQWGLQLGFAIRGCTWGLQLGVAIQGCN